MNHIIRLSGGMVYLPAGRQARTTKRNMFYFVYVLKNCSNNTFYKGITQNLEKRLHQHCLGQTHATKSTIPLKLIHVEICETRLESRKLEKFFKSGYGREIIKEIESNLN